MNRQAVYKRFASLFPDVKHSPRYQKVKKLDSFLYSEIMRIFNGYRAFLRAMKRPMPPTSKKEWAFIRYSSRVSRRYYENCWSSLEEITFCLLELTLPDNDFIHNFPWPSPKGSFYKLDFYSPRLHKVIEADGIYHTALPTQRILDAAKDAYLKTFNVKVLRLNSNDFNNLPSAIKKVRRFLYDQQGYN